VQDTKWNRAKQVFHEALEKTAAERTRFVAAACADDPDVRAQVDALLAAHVEAGEFLALTTGAGAALAAVAAAGGASIGWPEGPGSWIGPYKLLQLIGEGGFGVVYMAEQEEPIRRRVALKIIKPGMDTKQVIARFESERQALAMMDHPNIAKVLDAGATVSGRPYFVMELVKGVPLTDYCDANRLSTRERLDLFAQVCNGVHHAHEKGIIHRDIKPSNVMVTLHDAAPVPKIIDFGVAKATNQRLTEKTLFTAYGACIGTPTYMSPEQAEMSGLDIDRRSDVYSLGVLLYELLTGTTPLDAERLRSAAFGELQRMIREDDPPTPSARLSTLGDRLTEVARNRHAEPQVLTKLVRGDLDWIVMKAIEKDRRRRYDSAAHIVEDVSRFVKDEPVAARRPSPAYRFRKFAKRRRVALAVVAGIVAALSLGVGLARFFGLGDRGGAARPTQRLVFDEVGKLRRGCRDPRRPSCAQIQPGPSWLRAGRDRVGTEPVSDGRWARSPASDVPRPRPRAGRPADCRAPPGEAGFTRRERGRDGASPVPGWRRRRGAAPGPMGSWAFRPAVRMVPEPFHGVGLRDPARPRGGDRLGGPRQRHEEGAQDACVPESDAGAVALSGWTVHRVSRRGQPERPDGSLSDRDRRQSRRAHQTSGQRLAPDVHPRRLRHRLSQHAQRARSLVSPGCRRRTGGRATARMARHRTVRRELRVRGKRQPLLLLCDQRLGDLHRRGRSRTADRQRTGTPGGPSRRGKRRAGVFL
jgi:serine/threonine protein kinase